MSVKRSAIVFALAATAAVAAGQTVVTGIVPVGASATLFRNGSAVGAAAVDARGNASYTLGSSANYGDVFYFAWSGSSTATTVPTPQGAQIPWTPQNLSSAVVAWWDPSQGVTMNAGGTAVASWTDRVGGIVASQATAANQPGYSATARNGKPGLTFNGTSQALSFSAAKMPVGAVDRSFFVAGYSNAATDQKLFAYGTAANGQWVSIACYDQDPHSAVINTYASTDVTNSTYLWQNNDRIFYAAITGGNTTTSVWEGDPASLQSRTNSYSTTTAAGFIGQDIRGGNAWSGTIQHILVFNRALTTNERQLLEGWESWADGKAGANLPSTHPFKSRAPLTSDVAGATPAVVQQVFFETDLSTDIDDVAAIAVLAYQSRQGNINLIGANTNSADVYSAPCLRAMLNYLGLSSTPVGAYQGTKTASGSSAYTQQVTARFRPSGETRTAYMDPVVNLRTQLAAAANGSVTICSVGFLTNIAALLASPADGISSMTGLQLVTAKVKSVVIMAGYETSGYEFNMQTDTSASQSVIANLPKSIPIVGVDFNFGNSIYFNIPTGGNATTSPLAYAYSLFGVSSRQSWDVMAAMLATGQYGNDFVNSYPNGTLTLQNDGGNSWAGSPSGNWSYYGTSLTTTAMGAVISSAVAQAT